MRQKNYVIISLFKKQGWQVGLRLVRHLFWGGQPQWRSGGLSPIKFDIFFGTFVSCILSLAFTAIAQEPDNDTRVESLLAQMTLDEKIGQMTQVDSSALTDKADVQ